MFMAAATRGTTTPAASTLDDPEDEVAEPEAEEEDILSEGT